MKLILFAFAAIAFSGSSKAKEDADKTPSEPEKPVPQTTPQPEPQPEPQPVTPTQPEPEVELSKEEKEHPLEAFDDLISNVKAGCLKLVGPLKDKVEDADKKLALANSELEKAEKAMESATVELRKVQALPVDPELLDLETITTLKKDLETKRKLENKSWKKVEASKKRVTEAQTAYNAVYDKVVAEADNIELKAPLFVKKVKENAESADENVEGEKLKVKESETDLEKAKKLAKNVVRMPQRETVTEKDLEFAERMQKDADKKVLAALSTVKERQAALEAANTKAAEALTTAQDLEKTSVGFSKQRASFVNKNKKY